MVGITVQSTLPQNPPPPTGPGPGGTVRSGLGLDAEKLVFKRKRLRINGLGGVHDRESTVVTGCSLSLIVWHLF
jgi:hypothetical protein